MLYFCVDGLDPDRKPVFHFADLWIETWTVSIRRILGFQHRLPTSGKELPQLLQVEKWGLGNVKMCLVYSCPRPWRRISINTLHLCPCRWIRNITYLLYLIQYHQSQICSLRCSCNKWKKRPKGEWSDQILQMFSNTDYSIKKIHISNIALVGISSFPEKRRTFAPFFVFSADTPEFQSRSWCWLESAHGVKLGNRWHHMAIWPWLKMIEPNVIPIAMAKSVAALVAKFLSHIHRS